MKISIITVAFNAEKTIADTIQSVLNQSYPNIEYLIIDGDSTDKTVEIIQSFGKGITHFVSEKDNGLYDAMNKGIGMATGEVVGILNADDLYTDNEVLADIVKLFQPNIDGVYADLNYVKESDTNRVTRRWVSGNYVKDSFLKGWMPPHPTFFVRKKCYNELGRFNTTLRSSADYELMLRFIHKNNINLAYLNRVIVKMRTGGQSNSSLQNRVKANKEDRKAWELNGLKPSAFTFIRKPLSKLMQFLKK